MDVSWPSNIVTGSRIDFLDAAPGCVELEAICLGGWQVFVDEFGGPLITVSSVLKVQVDAWL